MKLAINGGTPVRKKNFPAYNYIGAEEKEAVNRVLDSGVLSKYLGAWRPDFFGGSEVQALEKEWAEYFGVKHAISVNSATSGLYAAVGALGIEPGDEVIVSPYTMSASATAPLVYGAIPVFADVEEDMFCLDPESVEKCITPRTRAIIAVDIFGQAHNANAINAIARKHGLKVIEDTAQAPGAKYHGKYAGTLSDIGVFSLNYHKHIHCGEGGIVVTNSDELAERVQLIRNHAEAVVGAKGTSNLTNMVGFNYRLPEIESAITRCQLRKLKFLVEERQKNCAYIAAGLRDIPAITAPVVRENSTHVFYSQPFRFNAQVAGVSRNRFIDAVKAELPLTTMREQDGPLIGCGYVKPLYLQPLFQKQIAFGKTGFPFRSPWNQAKQNYAAGLCPVTERLHEHELFSTELMRPPMTKEDLDDVLKAYWKVWEQRKTLS